MPMNSPAVRHVPQSTNQMLSWVCDSGYRKSISKPTKSEKAGPLPVSYTHLDVYKRQHISSTTLLLIISIVGFIIFIFKIHDKKNEKNAYRNSLFMALIGVIILILSFSIDKNNGSSASGVKTLLLFIGAIYILYGGYYALSNNNKNMDDSK